MQRSEDFYKSASGLDKGGFSQTQELSQKLSKKIELIKLVVVMSAVDWWKSSQTLAPLENCPHGVAWISMRICGKTALTSGMDKFAPHVRTVDPQVSHAMFTRCRHATQVTLFWNLYFIWHDRVMRQCGLESFPTEEGKGLTQRPRTKSSEVTEK